MQTRKWAVLVTMIVMLAGCGENPGITGGGQTLDASSESAMTASMETMTADMNKSDQQKVAQAVVTIMMIMGFSMMGEDITEAETNARLLESVDGLTALELVEEAERLAAEMKTRE